MGERATELGVDMYTGFAGDDFILGKINSQSQTKGIAGVTTNDFGISKDLKLKRTTKEEYLSEQSKQYWQKAAEAHFLKELSSNLI
jgi:hypothetical protein